MCWPETPVTVAPVLTGSPEGGGERERERERERDRKRWCVCLCEEWICSKVQSYMYIHEGTRHKGRTIVQGDLSATLMC